jgi:putative MATE family efflux protein
MKPGSARFTDGPVERALARTTLQMLLGILAMVAFNLVDTFFVGQLGKAELAAMAFTFPVVTVFGGLALGLGQGASAVISRALGVGDRDQVRRLTTDALLLSVVVVTVLVVVGLATVEPLFRAMGASDELLPLIEQYMRIWYVGMPFVVIPMVGNNAIRATGDARTPAMIMLVVVLVNAVLDPLLIFGLGPFPRMELAGAALTTVFARAAALAASMWVLTVRDRLVTSRLASFALTLSSWRRILWIGLPDAGTRMVLPVGAGVVTRLVAGFGKEAVAAFGVASRLDIFALAMVMALCSMLGPFVGQNHGAGLNARVRRGVRSSQLFAISWGVLGLVVLWLGAPLIAGLFSEDPLVVAHTVRYLRIVPFGYGLVGVLMVSNTTLNVLERPLHASGLTLLQMFGLYVPLAVIGGRWLGLQGIFGAALVANGVTGVAAYLVLRRVMRRRVPTRPSR